ncbi:MAG: family 43 glycosylhydrolase [Fibrobacteres bacterium]|nr:family 43 glycosylhydrolase [Fibrobacterota bacterium]
MYLGFLLVFSLVISVSAGTINSVIPLYDTNGDTIRTSEHDIVKFGDTWYMYGADPRGYAGYPEYRFFGITLYSSKDLISWKNEGVVLDKEKVESSLNVGALVLMPHVLYNAKNNEYVLILETANTTGGRKAAVFKGPTHTGPFQFHGFMTNLLAVGSITIFRDTDDKVYFIYDPYGGDSAPMHIYELNDNYYDVKLPMVCNVGVPMEGEYMIKEKGNYFIFGSALTGWAANDNFYLSAPSIRGPWTRRGFFAEIGTNTYNSQCFQILRVTGSKGTATIYTGTRWNPNLRLPRQIWLPLVFDTDTTVLQMKWYDQWTLDTAGMCYPIGYGDPNDTKELKGITAFYKPGSVEQYDTVQISAIADYVAGFKDTTFLGCQFFSLNTFAATIDVFTGKLIARNTGLCPVRIVKRGFSDTFNITIVPTTAELDSIRLSFRGSQVLTLEDRQKLNIRAYYRKGNISFSASADSLATLVSDMPGVVAVTDSGLNCIQVGGPVKIVAGFKGKNDTLILKVVPKITSSPALVTYLPLNETVGSKANDATVFGNNGTLSGGVSWSTGKQGGALSFSGSNNQVAFNESRLQDVKDSFTLAFWVKPTAARTATTESNIGVAGTGNQRYLFFPTQGSLVFGSGHAGVGLSVGTNGISVFEHSNSYMPSLLVFDTVITEWTHITLVYVNRQPHLYINGKFVKSGVTGTKVVHPSLTMGGTSYGWYQGSVDEIALYSYPLDESAVALLPGGSTSAKCDSFDKKTFSCSVTPNPFNPVTRISFSISAGVRGYYAIYNSDGREIRRFDIVTEKGFLFWDGKDSSGKSVSTGVYLGKLVLNNGTALQNRLVLMK